MTLASLTSSLRIRLVLPVVAIILILSLGLIGIGYWAGNAIVNVMSEQLIRHMTGSISVHAGLMMNAPSQTLARVQRTIARHDIPLDEPRTLARELFGLLSDEPDVDWIYFSNDAGGIVSVGRLADGARVIAITDGFRAGVFREYDASVSGEITGLRKSVGDFDARQKTWYKATKETNEPYWTEPYLGSVEPILGISLAVPDVDENGYFTGVYGVDLILTRMSDYMGGLRLGDTGRAFLIDTAGYLIAASGGVMPVIVDKNAKQHRLHARYANDPLISAVARHLDRHPTIVERSLKSSMQPFSFEDPALGEVFAAVQHFQVSGGISWLIISALPASDFLGSVRNAAYLSLTLAALIVLGALAVGFWEVGRALRPITALTTAAHAIAGGEWPNVPETNRKDEIGVLARAFSHTIRTLQKLLDTLEQRIADRQRAEADREMLLASERAARAAFERANRMKDEFLATLSHELRTPLNAVLGWSQILLSGHTSAQDLRRGLETIERNARAQTKLTEDLLDMSRITSGRLRLDIQAVDLAVVLESAIESVKPAAEAKGIRLEHHVGAIENWIMGDPCRLQQVMWNLLSNAIKFTPRAGRVNVSMLPSVSNVQITVSDTGIGIEPAFLGHVFERFRQADASTTRQHGGLGLGLAIVRHLVELHGGTVEVASAGKDQGASFTVKLPLSVRQPEIVAGSPPPAIHCRGSWDGTDDRVALTGVRVLVVDDEPDIRELIGRVLAEHHMEVRTVGSAAEALIEFDQGWPMVLVSDISMPEEDGYALIRRVRQLPQERGGRVPALALTAFARAEDRARAIVEGYQMHMAKPFEPWELLACVARLAGRTNRVVE